MYIKPLNKQACFQEVHRKPAYFINLQNESHSFLILSAPHAWIKYSGEIPTTQTFATWGMFYNWGGGAQSLLDGMNNRKRLELSPVLA